MAAGSWTGCASSAAAGALASRWTRSANCWRWPPTTPACAEVDALTRRHLAGIGARIADLTALAGDLRRVSRCRDGGGVIAGCRILQALDGDATLPG